MYACLHGTSPQLAELARRFSPLVQPVSADAVVFSIDGLSRLIGDERRIASEISRQGEELGVTANLAIAANPTAAILAARNITGVTIVARGQEAEALAALPIEALDIHPDLSLTLLRWGIHTFGELAALPEMGLVERFGAEGSRLRRLALGQGDSILDIRPPEPEYTLRQEFEHPVELLEPLLFIISSQLHELIERLQRNGQATNRVTIDLTLEHGTLQRAVALPVPSRDALALLKQVQLALEANPPRTAIVAVQVTLAPADPRVRQDGLFLSTAPEPEALHTLLARLRALTGQDRVGSPEILNTHRPDAYRFRPCAFEPSEPQEARASTLRLAFRYFRPAVKARIVRRNGLPQRIHSEPVSGEIVQAAGPWRTNGGWWTDTPWNRDEWDVVLTNRSIYRVYSAQECWFIDGSYD